MKDCNGKICFDKKSAESARNKRLKPKRRDRRRNTPEQLRIYHCQICNHWHLTSKPKYEPLDPDHDKTSRTPTS